MTKRMLMLSVALSGVNTHLTSALEKAGWAIDQIDVPKPKIVQYINMLRTFYPNKVTWRNRHYDSVGKTPFAFKVRTNYAYRRLKGIVNDYDVVFQIGGMFSPAPDYMLPVPYVTYNDFTMKIADREWSPWAPFSNVRQADKWYALESKLYQNAARVFTFSENTRRSVIQDYGADPKQVVTTNSGANLASIPDDKPRSYHGHKILFIGIDFERKGGPVMLEAFAKVRQVVPDAELILVGPDREAIKGEHSGVRFEGLVKDRKKVLRFYDEEACVFALPSICDPFPNVFFEAMAHKLPCLGTTASGMPEQVADGETGFSVEPRDAETLSDRLIRLLTDKDLCRRMGESGYNRVTTRFVWHKVAERMTEELDIITRG